MNAENPNLPAFMQGDDQGTENLGQFIIPPRLKVVQKQSGDAFLESFNQGDTILVPQMMTVAPVLLNDSGRPTKEGETFNFTPLFFFPEWVTWNPLETRGSLAAIRERTTDPNDELVAKCRNNKLWFEQCPEQPELQVRNVEHLNFLVVLLDGELAGTPCILTFARAEHKSGSSFAALIKMRKAPIYGCVFQAKVGFRDNGKGQWYGLDIGNPEGDSGWVEDQEMYERFKQLHLEFKEAHESQRIRPDYGDDTESEASNSADTEF